jgi:hypothetical protein
MFKQIESLVEEEASRTPRATMLAIALAISKTSLSEYLLNEDGQVLVEVLKGDKLCQVMDKFIVLFSPYVWNLVASFKYRLGDIGYISSILAFKTNNGYCYIQDSCFPRQQLGDKLLMFKMSMHGNGSGYDLVKQMQPRGNLQTVWIMFDHVKHVKGWTTLACHVYDFLYYKVMMIVICDMQYEDMAVQCVMWWNLNKVMANNGVPNPNFKGFMANSI